MIRTLSPRLRRALALSALLLAACGGEPAEEPIAGLYEVDKQHYEALLIEDLKVSTDPVVAGKLDPASIGLFLEQMEVLLRIEQDGTWTIRGRIGMDTLDDAGTWTATEDSVVLRFTRERGRPVTKTVTARREADGTLLVRPSPEQPGAFRMVRRKADP